MLDAPPLPLSWSDADGRISYWNRRAEALFGYASEELPDLETWYERAYADAAYRRRGGQREREIVTCSYAVDSSADGARTVLY